jgi:hypothetical protein
MLRPQHGNTGFPLNKPTNEELKTIGEPYGIKLVKGSLRVSNARQLQESITRDIELPIRTIELHKYINRARIALAENLEVDEFRARQLVIAGSNIYASAIQSITNCIVIPSNPTVLSRLSVASPESAKNAFSAAADKSGLLAVAKLIEPEFNLADKNETTIFRAGLGVMHTAVINSLTARQEGEITANII